MSSRDMLEWGVIRVHLAVQITYHISPCTLVTITPGKEPAYPESRRTSGWCTKELDEETFMEVWLYQPSKAGGQTEKAFHVTQCFPNVCDASMPRRYTFASRRYNYSQQ